jgi:hypothetical protein
MSFAGVYEVYEAIIAIALIIAGMLVVFSGPVRVWGALMILLGVLLLIFWLSGVQSVD